jgi:hypothetical protein
MSGTGYIKLSLWSATGVNSRRLASRVIVNTQNISHWEFKNSIDIKSKFYYVSKLFIKRSVVE